MENRTFVRRFKVNLKHRLDHIRPYPALTGWSPFPAATARQLGAVIHAEASVSGRLALYEPAWFQMNRGGHGRNLTQAGPFFCLICEGASLENRRIDQHTIALKNRILTGSDIAEKSWRMTVDFEGAAAMKEISPAQHKEVQQATAKTAAQILESFIENGVPSTWYVVSSMFRDPHLSPVCCRLIEEPSVQIGWHSHTHPNFYDAGEGQIHHELEELYQLEREWGIRLSSLAFPYNAVGHLELLLREGLREFRGYIGQYYLPFTVDFGDFRFVGTSQYIGPNSLAECRRRLPTRETNFTFFLHPVDWIGSDLQPLADFLTKIAPVFKKEEHTNQ